LAFMAQSSLCRFCMTSRRANRFL